MPMKNPPHPGTVVRVSCLEPLGLNVTDGAKVLGVSRQALSNLVNGRARMSSEMAIRLAKAFGSTTETWIRLQTAYDVVQAHAREDEIEIEPYEPQPGSIGSDRGQAINARTTCRPACASADGLCHEG